MSKSEPKPVVLSFSGHDPCGGAGVQADVEAISANGGHCCNVITCLTLQDTCNVYSVTPLPPDTIASQARLLLVDLPVAAIKIGLIGSAEIALVIASLLQEFPDLPVVLDPVLAAGGGASLGDPALISALRERLLPRARLLTPNWREARTLSGETDMDACAARLQGMGCVWVLATGADEPSECVENRLYGPRGVRRSFVWQRLPAGFHGSGCTLAAAVAARLARGEEVAVAVAKAQAYTWNSLKHGFKVGRCQHLPDRWYRHASEERA